MRPALALVVLLAACGDEDATRELPPRLVVTAPAARHVAVERLSLLGDIRGEVEVRVVADLAERVQEVHARNGDRVEAGDPLLTLEASLPSSDLAQAAAARDVARADRDRLAADLARMRPLVEGNALPRAQLEQLEASLRAADARVTQLGASQRAARLRRGRTVVRAPTSGIVAGLEAKVGDLVAPQVPVAEIVRMERVEVTLRVVEEDFVRLRPGLVAVVAPPSLPGLRREGTVLRLSPVLDRVTRTGEVVVQVDNADGQLRPGMVAEVGIELARREDVLMVPSRALLLTTRTEEDRLARVFVVEDGVAKRRDVRIGQRYPGEREQRVEITEGLEAGAQVVVRGQTLLRDGVEVRAQGETLAAAEAQP